MLSINNDRPAKCSLRRMLKIRKSVQAGNTIFLLSGRIKEEDVSELIDLLKTEKHLSTVILDLQEVRLVHREAVRFLASCEIQGITLKNCPAFVREWILTGSDHEPRSSAIGK
jgi:hypothetical protein